MNKRLGLLIAMVLVVMMALAALMTLQGPGKKEKAEIKSTTFTDPDTGKEFITDENVTPENISNVLVTIVGGDELYNNMSSHQFDLVRSLITEYVKTQIDKKIGQVKILPESINATEKKISATMKIDEPLRQITLDIGLVQARAVNITFTDPKNTTTPTYNTGFVEEHMYEGDED